MDKKSKIFIIVILVLILTSVAFTYYRIVIKKDYIVEAQIDCDPEMEACFIWECDPESEEEGEACTEDPEENIWYYKIAQRNASRIPLCDPNQDEDCSAMICDEGEKDCSEKLCDEISAEEQGVSCNDPEEYLANNPPEEETQEECEEGDEECAAAEEEDEAVVCDNENSEECQEGEIVPADEEEGSEEEMDKEDKSDEPETESDISE